MITGIFKSISPAPEDNLVRKYMRRVLDPGDAHVLAAAIESRCQYLVTLDKKHLLVLQGKIRGIKIVSPSQLIKFFSVETKRKAN